jgi:hypothetical protein
MEPKDRRRRDSRARPITNDPRPGPSDSSAIDAAYGLEPVFEPREGAAPLDDFVAIQCPYCAERYGIAVDLTAGSQTQIEDCQICCQPIEFSIRVGRDGRLRGISPRRLD